jgi:glycosyltransferase involved in cell wall biosynthesis
MRVLAVVHQFPPYFESGTEILCLRTMQALAERGHAVYVVAADHRAWRGGPVREDRVDGVDVTRIPTRGRPRMSVAGRLNDEFERAAVADRLVDAARGFAPDIIHAYHVLHFGVPAVERLAQSSPLVFTTTDFALACPYATLSLPDGSACAGPARDGSNCAAHHLSRPAHNGLARKPGTLAVLDYAAARLARAAGIDTLEKVRGPVLNRLEASRRLLGAARRVLVTSGRLRNLLVSLGGLRESIEVVPHQAPPVDVPLRPVGDPLRIGFLGVLQDHKGAHVLIEAVRKLPAGLACDVIVRGDLAADARYVAELRASAAGDSRVRIVDRVPHHRFGEALGEIDVLVVPSIWTENVPLVLLSALHAGRYAVVSDVAGLTDAVAGPEAGRAFSAGDSAALAGILAELVRDPTPVRRARERGAGFGGFAGYIDRLEAIYQDVVGAALDMRRAADGTVA